MTNKVTPAAGNVFVVTYGSLRTNLHNCHVNGRAGGKLVGLGKTAENFNLYRYGGAYFPSVSLAHNSNGKPVVVEVYEAPQEGLFGSYDGLEGYPHFYNRTKIDINMDDGTTLTGWIYHIDEEQRELVESGDWATYLDPEYYDKIKG